MPNPTPESLLCPHCGGTGKVRGVTDYQVGYALYRERRHARIGIEFFAELMERSVYYVDALESGRIRFEADEIAAYRAGLAKAQEAKR